MNFIFLSERAVCEKLHPHTNLKNGVGSVKIPNTNMEVSGVKTVVFKGRYHSSAWDKEHRRTVYWKKRGRRGMTMTHNNMVNRIHFFMNNELCRIWFSGDTMNIEVY